MAGLTPVGGEIHQTVTDWSAPDRSAPTRRPLRSWASSSSSRFERSDITPCCPFGGMGGTASPHSLEPARYHGNVARPPPGSKSCGPFAAGSMGSGYIARGDGASAHAARALWPEGAGQPHPSRLALRRPKHGPVRPWLRDKDLLERRLAEMYACEVCGVELDSLAGPGVVYAVELEMVHSRRGLEQLEGRGAFFHVTCFPEESGKWGRKPMPATVYEGGG